MRLIVKYREDGTANYVNIHADRMDVADGIVYAYASDKLVGVFDLGAVDMAYLSGVTG